MERNQSIVQLPFGIDSHVALSEDTLTTDCGDPTVQVVEDVAGAVKEALRHPIEYPAVADITIPEDRIAIVPDENVPCVSEIILALVEELTDAGIAPENIQILKSGQNGTGGSLTRLLPSGLRDRIEVVQHRADDRESLGFIGPAKKSGPIYVSRPIADADVVIPVGTVKSRGSLGYFGVHGTFVAFSDEATQQRFFCSKSALLESEKAKRAAEINELAWMLGTRMTVQVIPGPGESIARVLAGDAEHVERRVAEQCDQLWRFTVDQKAKLVVAALSGGRQQQTWQDFARALHTALRVVEPDGAVAICSCLRMRPGTSLKKLIGADSLEDAERKIAKEKTWDALAAAQLVRALEQIRVYLLSELDEDFVEDLGMAYVSHPDEIARLASRQDSCIAIANAQHTVIELVER